MRRWNTNDTGKTFYKIYNTLGYSFLEEVFERAMLIELRTMGLTAESQKRVLVSYYSQMIGDYNADLTVSEVVICELKAAECLCE